jgi:hypothetical protein
MFIYVVQSNSNHSYDYPPVGVYGDWEKAKKTVRDMITLKQNFLKTVFSIREAWPAPSEYIISVYTDDSHEKLEICFHIHEMILNN